MQARSAHGKLPVRQAREVDFVGQRSRTAQSSVLSGIHFGMRSLKTTVRALLLAPVLLAGCAVSPDVDRRVGAQMAEQIAQQMPLLEDDRIAPFIAELGDNLVEQLGEQPFDYQFFVIDFEEPNAFAVLGGYIYFSRGLLVLANTEDELAGVMGHEIIHVDQRHTISAARRGVVPGLLKLPGRAVGLVHSGLGDSMQSPFVRMTASYSRDQETEADVLGAELSARAGYQPAELADLLKRLASVGTYQTGEAETFNYFDSHPYTPDRARDIKAKAGQLQPSGRAPITKNRAAFMRLFEGMVIGEDPAHGVFVGSSFFHTELDIALDFPPGWITLNTPRYVIAAEPDEKAQLVFGIDGEAGDPAVPAREFKQELSDAAQVQPSVERSFTTPDGHPGYYMAVEDNSDAETVTLHFVWLSKGKYMYRFVGMGHDEHTQSMRDAVMSVRQISTEERSRLYKVVFAVAQARSGETITGLSERTNNALEVEFTAIINGRDVDETLPAGELIKIGAREPVQ